MQERDEAIRVMRAIVARVRGDKLRKERKPYRGREHTPEQIHEQGLHLVPPPKDEPPRTTGCVGLIVPASRAA